MNFKDFSFDCVWRVNKGSTYHTVRLTEVEEDRYDMVSETKRGDVGHVYFCGAHEGVVCSENICAPFHFVQRYHAIQERAAEKFLGELE